MNILCIAGPTASGKTALAVELAKALDGEVVSCDSMQLYRGMDIGTAKPTPEEMQGVPHYMLDVCEPDEDFSAGRYVQTADPIVQDILRRGKRVIVAGGTGLYMDALVAGRTFAPAPPPGFREALEARADREGTEVLLAEIARRDPQTAARLHPSDRKRILRALEIEAATGMTETEYHAETQRIPPKYRACRIALTYSSRAQLYARIDRRVDQMLEAGLLDEIHALLAKGVPENCTAMQAIGYKEFLAFLRGECTLTEAADAVKLGSRHYAKRQLTWLRGHADTFWLDRTEKTEFSAVLSAARQIIADFDSGK